MSAKLKLCVEGKDSQSFEIGQGELRIGRSPEVDIVLPSPAISRYQCVVRFRDGQHVVTDLQSTNGTFVNGRRINEQALDNNAVITFGKEPRYQLIFLRTSDMDEYSTAEIRAVIEEEAIEEYRDIISSKIKASDAKSAMEMSVASLETMQYVDPKMLNQIRRNLRVLYDVGEIINETHDAAIMLQKVAEYLGGAIGADRSLVIYQREVHGAEGEGAEFEVKASWCRPELAVPREDTLSFSAAIVRRVVREKVGVLFTPQHSSGSHGILEGQIQNSLCAPLVGSKHLLGALYVDSFRPKRTFAESDLSLLVCIANQVGLALEYDAQHREQIHRERSAGTDEAIAGMGQFLGSVLAGGSDRLAEMDRALRRQDARGADKVWNELKASYEQVLSLLQAIQAYSTERDLELVIVTVNEFVKRICDSYRSAAMHESVELAVTLDPKLKLAWMDEKAVEEAVRILIANAFEAIEDKPEKLDDQRRIEVRTELLPDGDYYAISVRDTGLGISDEVLPRIWSVFFGTKGSGGSGLGLAIARKIAKLHKGAIQTETHIGRGTKFIMILPTSRQLITS
jgi:two-component system NtrC family sensor kinase